MKLLANWRDVLRRAWSIRLTIPAARFSRLEVALPLLDGVIDVTDGLRRCPP
jgi:hypothetical protein